MFAVQCMPVDLVVDLVCSLFMSLVIVTALSCSGNLQYLQHLTNCRLCNLDLLVLHIQM